MSKKEEERQKRQDFIAALSQNVPQELTGLPNWVLWSYRMREGKQEKVLKTVEGRGASTTDPKTWTTFENACSAYINSRRDGIGFVFTDTPYLGIDIDYCIDQNGNVSELAKDIVRTIEQGYAEISPSGTGLHVIVKAQKPAGKCRVGAENGQRLEMYDTSRYFTVTGNVYEDELGYKYGSINTEAEEVQDAVYAVFGKYWRSGQLPAAPEAKTKVDAGSGSGLSDETIISRIVTLKAGRKTKEGDSERIAKLWAGDWEAAGYESQSQADLAFMDCLAFWTGKDAAQMERLFNSSGLFRPKKWAHLADTANNLTYGQQLITKACATTKAVYAPQRKKKVYFPKIDEEGNPISAHVENIKAMLDYLGISVRFNDITHKVDVYRGSERDGMNYESVMAELKSLCHEQGLKVSKDDLFAGCRYWADKDHHNPLTSYFWECYKQFKDDTACAAEFSRLCDALPLVDFADKPFSYHLLRLWLRQAVYISNNDGSKKPQSMLVLRGGQGIGKSSLVAKLLPRDLILTEQGLDMNNKDIIMACTSTGICELSELGGTLKEANSYKRFITAESDTYRAPYDRIAQTYPRRTSYIGTVNDSTFLIDKTGDRRYFVLPLKAIDWDLLARIDFQKLWAFIVSECAQHLPYTLTREQAQRIMVINRRYSKLTDVEQQIIDLLCWEERKDLWRLVSPSELCEELTGNVGRANVFGRRLAEMADRGEIEQPVEQHATGVRKYRLPCKRISDYDN